MKRLLSVLLIAGLVGGCATLAGPEPLSSDQVIAMSKAGDPAATIIRRLQETYTVLPLSASEILRLNQAGVAAEVLDYLQGAQINEVRRREAMAASLYGCPWGGRLYPPGYTRLYPYRWGVGPWGC